MILKLQSTLAKKKTKDSRIYNRFLVSTWENLMKQDTMYGPPYSLEVLSYAICNVSK